MSTAANPAAKPAAQPAAGQPTRQDAMRALLAGIAEDLQAYTALTVLLEQQFDAAVRHQGPRLAEVADQISTLVDQANARRLQRVALAQHLNGPEATMAQAFALLKQTAREKIEADWRTLEGMVLECKRLSKRNGDLLVEQHSIMQRVLHGEEHIYAPI